MPRDVFTNEKQPSIEPGFEPSMTLLQNRNHYSNAKKGPNKPLGDIDETASFTPYISAQRFAVEVNYDPGKSTSHCRMMNRCDVR